MSNSLKKVTFDPHITIFETFTSGLAAGGIPTVWPNVTTNVEYTNGTGDNQVDKVFHVKAGSVTASSAVTYDLSGSLTNPIDGASVVFVEIAVLAIRNTSASGSGSLKVGGGSNQWVTPFGAAGDLVNVRPGGVLILAAPYDGGGYAVTAGTGDILTIDATTGTCTYDLIVIGRSA